MPNEAIAHAATALGPDNQMRVWRSKDTPKGLMYPCQQAQIDWGAKSPAGLCPCCCPALPCPAPSCPSLPRPAFPCPALSYPVLTFVELCLARVCPMPFVA